MATTTDDVTEPPAHRIARETYEPDPLPEFGVFQAVIDATRTTIESVSGVNE